MKRRFILLAAALVVALVFGENAEAKKKIELKPVGIRLYHLEIQGRTAPVAVWYPAKSCVEEPFDYNNQVKGSACLDAEIDRSAAPYPLIVFSHGIGECGYQSVFYVENLARAGYVVAAMDHKDASMCVMEGEKKVSTGQVTGAALKSGMKLEKTVQILFIDYFQDVDFSYRPRDIKGLIDNMLKLNKNDKHLSGLIDPQKIGATGHSLGGFTTLALAGAQCDCIDPSTHPEETCRIADDYISHKKQLKPEEFTREDLVRMTCCLPEFKGKKTNLGDPRVLAALPLGPANLLQEGALSSVRIPVMIITGKGKMEVPIEPIQRIYSELKGPKYLLQLKKVDHMTISDFAHRTFVNRIALPGFRSHYKMKKEIYENFSRAFFDAYLKHDSESLNYIQQPNYKIVRLESSP